MKSSDVVKILVGALVGTLVGGWLPAYLGPESIADVALTVGESRVSGGVTLWPVTVINRFPKKFRTSFIIKCVVGTAGSEDGIDESAFDKAASIPEHLSPGADLLRSSGLRPGMIFAAPLQGIREKYQVLLRVQGQDKPKCEQISSYSWAPE